MNYLVIIDMQKDFNPNPETINYIKEFVENEGGKYSLVITIDTHEYSDYFYMQESKVYDTHCRYGTLGWEIVDELRPLVYNEKVKKVYKNTFGSLELATDINANRKEVSSITIMGVCTDICVLSNALILRAKMPNMRIIVDAAGCNGTSPEMHKCALALMKANAIEVINDEEQ